MSKQLAIGSGGGGSSIESQFKALEGGSNVDDELASMKKALAPSKVDDELEEMKKLMGKPSDGQ